MDEGPDDDGFDHVWARLYPRVAELPVVVPVSVMLGRTADAAVQLTCIEVYASGLQICVDARARAGAASRIMGPVEAVDGGLLQPNGDTHLTIALPSGERLEASGHRTPFEPSQVGPMQVPDADTLSLAVSPYGGGGPSRGYELRLHYWLTPRPTTGFVVEFDWTGLGIGPSRTPIGERDLADAYRDTAVLWT